MVGTPLSPPGPGLQLAAVGRWLFPVDVPRTRLGQGCDTNDSFAAQQSTPPPGDVHPCVAPPMSIQVATELRNASRRGSPTNQEWLGRQSLSDPLVDHASRLGPYDLSAILSPFRSR